MTNSIIKILNIILFLALVSKGYSQCSLHDIHISQKQTGATIHGKKVWSVTIANWCSCYQSNVMLNCKGFQSVEPIDPQFLKIFGNVCLVSNGQPLFRGVTVFNYAWDKPFPFIPISSKITC
ncbi:hypothetical protein D0Y65_028276 [Glycine soja]|uniref:Protein TAPETUM DETERMINANT 1 n=1 Tax=Glycine soja TaxID=3848 RepID=A0A0B2R9B7_GLYSO|nr:hypothetical protein glysoja_050389 [Glycine soja]RZB89357.1 hypothetical protein D0Y65_028276 [Glycine soja]